MPRRKSDDLPWIFGWVAVGACLSAKESIRFTALWHFDAKSLILVATISLLFLTFSAIVLTISKNREIPLYRNKIPIATVAFAQAAGMVVHALASFGFAFPKSALFLSSLGMEASLFLLLVTSQYLYSFDAQHAQTGFIYSMFSAGAFWILLVFLDTSIARLAISLLCPIAAALLWRSVTERNIASAAPGAQPQPPKKPEEDSNKRLRDFEQSMAAIFLVSLVIMGVYSQWQGQQDEGIASALIQICSGLGLVSAAAFSMIAHKRLRASSLFFICQAIVLPIALGALYLGTIFEGPGVSISVLLFDLAYGLILLSIWLAPYAYASLGTLFVLTAGFLAHKMGWAVGLALTRAFPWPEFQWVGTLVIIAAFLALIALSGTVIVKNRRDIDEALSVEPEYGYETACRIVGERYGLTKRENEILLLLAKGRTAPYLARDLFISESTARTHISHIYRKVGINSQQELLDEIERTHEEIVQEREVSIRP